MKITESLKSGSKAMLSPFVLQLLIIMFIVEFVKGALIITFLPYYMKNALGASAFVIGWTLAVQYIGDNLLRTPLGWLIDKFGYRVCMATGVVATFASIVIIATTGSFGWIIVACALLGIGTAPLWPCVISGATEITGDKASGTVLSIVYIAWLSGVGLGPFVITYFLGGHFASAFRLMLTMMAAAVVVALFLPGKLKAAHHPASVRAGMRQAGRMERIRTYLSEVNRSLTGSRLMFPAMFAQTFVLGLLTPVLTIYATNVLQLTQSQFRMLLIAGGAVTVGFMIPVGKMVDRWGPRRFLNIGFLLGAVTLLIFPFARTLPLLYPVVLLLGSAYALIIPAWNAQIAAAIPPEKRGAVWGFFLTIEGLGTTIAPIVSGKMWDSLGPQAPFITGGCVLLLMFALQLAISANKRIVVK